MCGISGFWEFRALRRREELQKNIESMTSVLAHRGPDGQGTWIEESAGVAFGHRRLSIIDLSTAGSQPMLSANERFVITFNGEIYNFQEIRKELENGGVVFRGHSDTEVLIEAIVIWGLDATVKKCIGMFAFALWDRGEQKLFLVRDRMGVKPLYYSIIANQAVLFASQSKSFLKHPYFKPAISLESTAGYLQYGYLPRSQSIYENTAQVLPGHIVAISQDGWIKQSCYWSLPTERLAISENEASERLEEILKSSIKLRMRADVPVGAFISGGVDSSAVVAYMQKSVSRKVKTFCIGFNNAVLDESKYAKAVANHLGTDHTEVIMDEKDLFSLIPTLPEYYDEPFADFSMLPTMLVSKIAREQVVVSLSGDGGDELFTGYDKYKAAALLLRIPQKTLRCLLPMIDNLPFGLWQGFGKVLGLKVTSRRIDRLKKIIKADGKKEILLDFYNNLWREELPLLSPEYSALHREKYVPERLENIEDMQRIDASFYLPDDILTKVDRASMAYGLEAREPLLDHRLVEFAFSLPLSLKLKKGKSKYLLRKALYKYVPEKLIDRPKQGFGPPLHEWLRGPLRDWAENLLDHKKLEQDGILDGNVIRKTLQNHLDGIEDNSFALWSVLMFQEWKGYYRV